jgi:ribosomal protein S18 acetylase RimI-like enzyme
MAPIGPEERNFSATWWLLAQAAPGGAVAEAEGVVMIATGVPFFYFNAAFVTDPSADPERVVDTAQEWFGGRALPFSLRFSEHEPAFADAAITAGLVESERSPIMAMSVEGTPPPPPIEGLEVRVVSDEAGFDDHVRIVAEAFSAPADWLRRVFTPALLDVEDFVPLVGYIAGEPVASSALVVTDGMGGVYNVGTPEQHRRQGYGEAMTWAAVEQAMALGCTATTLQASAMGKPIYERMGYRTLLDYRQFATA